MTAQVELLERFRVAWRRDRDATAGETPAPVTVPPVGVSAMAFSAGKQSALLPIPIAVEAKLATVGSATAGVPFEMMPAFRAEAVQVNLLEAPSQLNVLHNKTGSVTTKIA